LQSVRTVLVVLVLPALLLTACSPAAKTFKQAEREAAQHNWDQAVLLYSKAAALKPNNMQYSIALSRARFRASQAHFELAKKYQAQGNLDLAISELQATVLLDASNQFAADQLKAAVAQWRESKLDEDERTELERLKEEMKIIGTAPPKLDPKSNIPIVLKFEDQEIGKIYDALSRVTGLNFFYDDKLDLTKKVSVDVAKVSFEKAMDILMLQNKHFYKVIDQNSILIAEDTRQKRQEYEDEVIQTFFLSNADVKDVQTILRTLLDARKVAQNTQLNAITIRDSPEKVAIARRIIEANDKAKAELIIDVELLQINRSTLRNLGIDLTTKSLGISFNGSDAGLPLNSLNLLKDTGSWTLSPIPGFVFNFLKSDSDSKAIAKPQMRVSEGEKANLHIGDRIPIPTTTFNTGSTVGTNVVPITSFTYQEVGIIIEIEPRVHHNREVTLNLVVEISDVTGEVNAGGGVSQPIIGSREIVTVIRLKDGETNMLAGLLSEGERTSLSGVAGLSSIPVLKRIFGSTEKEVRQTDIVLTLTPHIIRIPDIGERDLEAMWIGREGNLKLKGSEGSAFGSPFSEGEAVVGRDLPMLPMGDILQNTDLVPIVLSDQTLDRYLGPTKAQKAAGEVEAEDEFPERGPEDVVSPPGDAGAPPPPPAGEEAGPGAESGGFGEDTEGPLGPQIPVPSVAEPEVPEPQIPVPGGGQVEEPPSDVVPAEGEEPEAQTVPPDSLPLIPFHLGCSPPTLIATPGSDFNQVIQVTGGADIARMTMTLEWDDSLLSYRSINAGNFFRQSGGSPSFQFRRVGTNQVRIETGLPGGRSASGVGAVALLRFRALAEGTSPLRFVAVEAYDSQGRQLEADVTDGRVVVQ
jgi:general secretion pathway protein D